MKSEITFLLNGDICNVSNREPTTTVLQWLRQEKSLTGSKEGCGEGDCGACSIVVGEIDGDAMRYKAVNACIFFVAMLEGKSVHTVEGVKGDLELHPVQEAFVKTHGTQCGFCTPGFVMSLFAAYLNGEILDAGDADTLFAGNLCRCTGYGPIVQAVANLKNQPLSAMDRDRIASDYAGLTHIKHDRIVCLEHNNRKFYNPATNDDLASLYAANPQADIIAGATDVGLWVTKQRRALPTVIYLGRVADLNNIVKERDKLIFGAGVTHSQAMPILTKHFPDLGEMIQRLGAVQVRNCGTLAGNIANGSPIGDMPPALMILDAKIHLRQGRKRRTMPLEDFFIDYGRQDRKPGEFIESIEVPLAQDDHNEATRFYKISKRFDQDISAVCGCFKVISDNAVITQARIAFGGMAAIPKRAKSVEAALEGKPWTEETLNAALGAFEEDFTPISDMRASATYRMQVSKNLLHRYFLETRHAPNETRIFGKGAFESCRPHMPL